MLNVPSGATANVDPDALLVLPRRGNGLGLEVGSEELEHRLTALEEVSTSRVVDVGLALVEGVEARLLVTILVVRQERLDEAVPRKEKRGANGRREAEDPQKDQRPRQRREGPSENGGRDLEMGSEDSLDRPSVSRISLGAAYERPVRRTRPLARSAAWVGLIIVEMVNWKG